jgi:hypothetical protein
MGLKNKRRQKQNGSPRLCLEGQVVTRKYQGWADPGYNHGSYTEPQ